MPKVIGNKVHHILLLAGVSALVTTTVAGAKNWGSWSAPATIESLPGSSPALNTRAIDGCASQSPDGLTLAFNSSREGNHDIYIATRSSRSEGFGEPERLLAPINTTANEACPTIATGNRLYFSSDRDDSAYDLYMTRRGPKGWNTPTRLGSNINTSGMMEEAADFYEDDDGRAVMIFTRRNLAGTVSKIYYSVDGGPAFLVQGGPHSSAADARASVTNDGLTIFFDSTRTGGLGGPDLYYATRSNTSEPFGTAIHLQQLSSPAFDARPFISKDGTMLTFSSGRSGSEWSGAGPVFPDMWFAERAKITGRDR